MGDLNRIFIAIDFPNCVRDEVSRIQEIIGKKKFNVKFTELENLHLTLKFLGGISNGKLEEVRKKLEDIRFGEFNASLENIGVFYHNGDPKIVWIKINGKKVLDLQERIDDKMSNIGFDKEKRFMGRFNMPGEKTEAV